MLNAARMKRRTGAWQIVGAVYCPSGQGGQLGAVGRHQIYRPMPQNGENAGAFGHGNRLEHKINRMMLCPLRQKQQCFFRQIGIGNHTVHIAQMRQCRAQSFRPQRVNGLHGRHTDHQITRCIQNGCIGAGGAGAGLSVQMNAGLRAGVAQHSAMGIITERCQQMCFAPQQSEIMGNIAPHTPHTQPDMARIGAARHHSTLNMAFYVYIGAANYQDVHVR